MSTIRLLPNFENNKRKQGIHGPVKRGHWELNWPNFWIPHVFLHLVTNFNYVSLLVVEKIGIGLHGRNRDSNLRLMSHREVNGIGNHWVWQRKFELLLLITQASLFRTYDCLPSYIVFHRYRGFVNTSKSVPSLHAFWACSLDLGSFNHNLDVDSSRKQFSDKNRLY